MSLGVFFAIATILLFGSWTVPTRALEIDPKIKAFYLTVGHFLLSSIVFIFVFRSIPGKDIISSLIAGALWGVGILVGYIAIKHLGITRALGIWIPVLIVASVLWGFLFFGEARVMGKESLTLSIVGIILLVIAALAVILSNKGEERIGNVKIGMLAALVIGIAHGSYFVPLRASSTPILVAFFPLTIGMLIATSLPILFKRVSIKSDPSTIFRMVSSGLILGAGNYAALFTTQYMGVSRGYPLTQLAIIINTLWGIFFFREVTTRKGKFFILIGVIAAIIGALVLNAGRG